MSTQRSHTEILILLTVQPVKHTNNIIGLPLPLGDNNFNSFAALTAVDFLCFLSNRFASFRWFELVCLLSACMLILSEHFLVSSVSVTFFSLAAGKGVILVFAAKAVKMEKISQI